MLTNYHTLHYITSTLAPRLIGRTICEAFSQEKDRLTLRFERLDDGLIISCEPTYNTLWLKPNAARARKNTADVLTAAVGRRINEVRMHPADRVVMFVLDTGSRLDACFFGSKANVFLVDDTERVLDAFKQAKQMMRTRVEYCSDDLVYDVDVLRARLAAAPNAALASVVKEAFPTLGSTLVKELLYRASVSTTRHAASITNDELLAIQRALASVLTDLAAPAPRAYLHEEGAHAGKPAVFSLIPLSHLSHMKEVMIGDVHEAIRFFISSRRSHAALEEQRKALEAKLMSTLSKTRNAVEAVEREVRDTARAEEYQHFGDLLMAHLHRIRRGDEHVTIAEEGLTIPLQKSLSPAENAQRYYEKAKRARAAHRQAAMRLAALRDILTSTEQLIAQLEHVSTSEEMQRFMTEHKNELARAGVGRTQQQRAQPAYRVFTVDGGFEVWVGKSSTKNDELTLKYAKPADLWFHVRGASGSHVVLKVGTGKGEPSKKAKEQAAAIAAYYSKMRNAKMVPVAMTEKKYVRKPKGAAPGTVVVEREKIIFAEPALPVVEQPSVSP